MKGSVRLQCPDVTGTQTQSLIISSCKKLQKRNLWPMLGCQRLQPWTPCSPGTSGKIIRTNIPTEKPREDVSLFLFCLRAKIFAEIWLILFRDKSRRRRSADSKISRKSSSAAAGQNSNFFIQDFSELERVPDPDWRPEPEEKLEVNKTSSQYYLGLNLEKVHELFAGLMITFV